ncbi:MAG: amidohydrolase family protein [Pseudomonadota bacterium]|nr:amidohydrolase family protein [Pseudomonadota bacterium]
MAAAAIIDSHHHLWRVTDLPWLQAPMTPRIYGPYDAIRRDYLLAELRQESAPLGVAGSVYIQCGWPPENAAGETRWVQSLADRSEQPLAIIGWANLADVGIGRLLDAHGESANFRGIRQMLNWHANTQYRAAGVDEATMADKAWRRGFAELAERGLIFELMIFPGKMAQAAKLAREYPHAAIVLEHGGLPADETSEGWAAWREGMGLMAAESNVFAKISGLGMFNHTCTAQSVAPVLREIVAMFGAERCMFGSNFPVDKLCVSYADMIAVYRHAATELSETERRAVMHDTAWRVYGFETLETKHA